MTSVELSEESSQVGPISHGQLVYLQLPSTDIEQSARFYAAVLGWHTDPGQAGFEAPGLIGQWVSERGASRDAGPLGWFAVADLDEALRQAEDLGGSVLEPPTSDGPERMLATVADPVGNPVGLVGRSI